MPLALALIPQQIANNPAMEVPDPVFAVVAVDLLGNVVQGIRAEIAPFIQSRYHQFMELLIACLRVRFVSKDPKFEVTRT